MTSIPSSYTVVVAIFHKNIYNIYQKEWVDRCIASIKSQTHTKFKVYELNYGNDDVHLWPNSTFIQKPFKNHVQAQNFLFDTIVTSEPNAVIFNTNLDDVYHKRRIAEQLVYINEGYDLVSSNFQFVNEQLEVINITDFHTKDIAEEFSKNHNIICHPVVAITAKFWKENGPYSEEEYHTKRAEDFDLWKRALKNNAKMIILPPTLCLYRVHQNQTGKIENNH